jgi:aminoglycoside phosphotransferase family enzyme/predicted kinase
MAWLISRRFRHGTYIAKILFEATMSRAEAAGDNSSRLADQDALLAAMLQPDFYPRPPAEVVHKETHISHLFFAGDLVYKVKKAVRYSFLDYSTLEKRRNFLQAELRLNRRLAPSVYIGVLPISFDDCGWRLGGWTEPAEYALVMRRLPDKRMLPFLLDSGQLTASMMTELAELLAKFHRDALPMKNLDGERYLAAVRSQWTDNLAEIQMYVGRLLDRDDFNALERYGREFLERHGELFKRRAVQGWIRDVHGDLHCEHICFAPEGIQVFDCIEFSSRLRRCDLASEIGFLVMDLEARGGAAWVTPFLSRYQELLPDGELDTLLPFAKCYRALIRGKVYALRGGTGFDTARRYFRYAIRLTWDPYQPFLLAFSGLTGSGKSTLARALSERIGIPTINSDVVRKSLSGKSGRQTSSYGEGIYSATMTARSYAKMARMAGKILTEKRAVMLDATFASREQHRKLLRLAAKNKVPLLLIHCFASDDTTRERLRRRQAQGQDVSDGRWEIYLEQKKVYQPLDETIPLARLELDTEPSLDLLISACEKFLRRHLDGAAR